MSHVTQQPVPKGYQQTEAGVIPKDWSVKNIGELSEVIRGASPRPKGDKRYYGGQVPRLMVQDVTRDGMYVTPQIDFLTEAGSKLSRPCKKGTLTLVCSGTVGVPSILAVDACIHDGFLALVKLVKNIDKNFLYQFFKTQQEKFDNSATHGGVFTNLTTDGVRDFLVPVPSDVAEQTAIANALSDVDALITSLEKLIAKKIAIKTAAMQQLLTGKTRLPPFDQSHTGYKQTDLGEIPEDWERVPLGAIARFHKGKGLPKADIVTGGRSECIHYGELFTQYSEIINDVISFTDAEYETFSSEENDILMPTSDVTPNGLATASGIKKTGVILGGDVLVIRPQKEQLDSSFFSYLISISKEKIMQLVTGSTVYHLYGRDMATFIFAKPSLIEEQVAIAEMLSDLSEEIVSIEVRLNKTQQLKQGMMQELLTGRTRLV